MQFEKDTPLLLGKGSPREGHIGSFSVHDKIKAYRLEHKNTIGFQERGLELPTY